MENESFEDEEVARVLNEKFVAIKVDREERPDVDHVYMTVCQAITGQGGWPLTIIMTPDKHPFFAGTYFPKTRKFGRIGLLELLHQVSDRWNSNRDSLLKSGQRIVEALSPHFERSAGGKASLDLVHEAYNQLQSHYDSVFGGFGQAPKFPAPHNLMFLLRYYYFFGTERALSMTESTLLHMARGGIYDHVGFGFSRYSTDERWLVPHFEKMLYDNALIAIACFETYALTKNRMILQLGLDVIDYVLRDMTSEEGAFYSAEDADSEGEEGKFYLWTPREVLEVLGTEDGEWYCQVFDITDSGNFEGRNIPNLISWHEGHIHHDLLDESDSDRARALHRKLYEARQMRVRPGLDDKVLTSWNSMMIVALCRAARVTRNNKYQIAAERAATFLERHLADETGRLLARYRDGEAKYPGYVDDYAYFIWARLELYQATFEATHLQRAVSLQKDMQSLFWDGSAGGYYFYGSDAETLIVRPKEIYDGATPSGNSVAASNLLTLFRFTGSTEYTEIAMRLCDSFSDDIAHYPMGHAFILSMLLTANQASREIVLTGDIKAAQTPETLALFAEPFLPDTVVLYHPTGEGREQIESLSPFTREQKMVDDNFTVYVCENFACRRPRTDWQGVLAEILASSSRPKV